MTDFQTPPWVCDLMVGALYRYSPNVHSVLEPTPGLGNLVGVLEDWRYSVTAPVDFWKVSGRFDAVVMNPPFTPMQTGYDILFRVMEMTDVIVALMPWLTIINSQRRTKRIVDFGLRSVIHLPRSVFPGSRVQTCILCMSRGFTGVTTLGFALEMDY